MAKRIAVVEDDGDIRNLVALHMRRAGYEVLQYADGGSFAASLSGDLPDLIILDLMLPDTDGLELCRRMKSDPMTASVPIIILTARAEESDRVVGLEMGADDYVVKPFSPRELVARARAVLRRRENPTQWRDRIEIGAVVLDPRSYDVTAAGRKIALSATEFRLFYILAAHPGRVFSRELLLRELWGDRKIVTDRTIDVHIKNIRRKLGTAGALIRNIRGVGYKVEP